MSRLISNIGVLIAYLIIFTVAYLPVVQTHYFYRDDYTWILPNASHAQLYKMFLSTIGSGRFLDGYSQYKVMGYVQYLQSTGSDSLIRFVGIIGIVLLAYVLFIIFKTNRIKTKYAFAASILICTLPGFQVYVSWIVLNPEICSATLSALAGLLIFKVVFKENRGRSLYRIVVIFIAALLFIISLHLYQPAALFYWSVGVIPLALLKDEDLTKKWRGPFITYFSVGFVSMAIYFIIVKTVNFVMDITVHPRGEVLSLTENAIKGKIFWFFVSPRSPLLHSLNLWNITPTYIFGGIIGTIILTGFLLGLRQAALQAIKEKKYSLLWNHSQRLLFIMSILPLSLISTLVVKESWSTYRTIISLEATVCILFFISLMNIGECLKSGTRLFVNVRKKIMPVILIILTLFVVYEAHSNVKTYFAGLQSLELEYMKNSIREYGVSNLSETSKIYVRDPDKKYYIDNRFRFEFGFSSMSDGYGEEIVNLALYELGIKKKKIIPLSADASLPEDSNILIIDLNELNLILDERFSKNRNNIKVP